jgi:putative endonuclease
VVRANNRAVGDHAENLAFHYLKQRGLVPVQRNFSCRLGEIDLIMRDEHCLVVIEVRYRSGRSLVAAEQTIDRRKQAKLIRTAAMFLAWNERFATLPMRFDVIGVDVDADGNQSIRWLRDAFRPGNARL